MDSISVFVIEDNPDDLLVAVQSLGSFPHVKFSVECADTIDNLRDLIDAKGEPDILIVDLGGTGFTNWFTVCICKPIVIWSGHDSPEVIAKTVGPADDFVSKQQPASDLAWACWKAHLRRRWPIDQVSIGLNEARDAIHELRRAMEGGQ